jgi:hypothetical protein
MSLTASSWKCPSQTTTPKQLTLAYTPPPASGFTAGSWILDDSSNNLHMLYGQYYTSNLFDMYTTGTPSSCLASRSDVGGSSQYSALQQTVNLTQLVGTWMGTSFQSPPRAPVRPNDCYRILYLQFFAATEQGAADDLGVEVMYVKHDTVSYDMFWASQTSSVVRSMEPVTGTLQLRMQLPADPDGVSHVLSTAYAPGNVEVPIQPITLHGSDSKCNSAFMNRPFLADVRPSIGQVAFFAIRLFTSAQLAESASRCDATSAVVSTTTFSGRTGSCIPWVNNSWSVVHFTRNGAARVYQYDDPSCQMRSEPSTFVINNDVNVCVEASLLHGQPSYALIQHASTLVAALHSLDTFIPRSSPTSTGGNGGTESGNFEVDTNTNSSASFPLTTIGVAVGLSVAILVAVFVAWCWHDTRRASAPVHPTTPVPKAPCLVVIDSV